MTDRNRQHAPLTGLQQAILERLWSAGACSAEDVRKALLPRHRLKDSSVRTLLRRLEARGLVSHATEGKTFVYSAEVPARGVAAGAVREIIRRFCSGSVEQFLVGMVDERVLSAKDLERLARKVRNR
jgi:predicted transcriptional regulator